MKCPKCGRNLRFTGSTGIEWDVKAGHSVKKKNFEVYTCENPNCILHQKTIIYDLSKHKLSF